MNEPLNNPADIAKEHFYKTLESVSAAEAIYDESSIRLRELLDEVSENKSCFNARIDNLSNAWKMYQPYARFECSSCKQKYQPRHYEQTTCNMCEAKKMIGG